MSKKAKVNVNGSGVHELMDNPMVQVLQQVRITLGQVLNCALNYACACNNQ